MARVRSDWSIYQDLKAAVESEIEDKMWGEYEDGEEPAEYVVAVSTDYEQVEALVDPCKEEKDEFLRQHSEENGWHSIATDDYEDIIDNWLQFGFDFR
jgi:hypothetical protein